MNKSLIKMIGIPITIISLVLMTVGALGLGYSFVTVILNSNYIQEEASIIEKVDKDGTKRIVLEYTVNEETFNSSFPFLENFLNQKIAIGYNPTSPTKFHLGNQNTHFKIFVWGSFLEMLGIMFMTLNHKFKKLID